MRKGFYRIVLAAVIVVLALSGCNVILQMLGLGDSVATISSIVLTGGTIEPVFSSDIYDYVITVPTDGDRLAIEIALGSFAADIDASNTAGAGQSISLKGDHTVVEFDVSAVESMTVTIVVTSSDSSTTLTYRFDVERGLTSVTGIAAAITGIQQPETGDTILVLPEVPDGFSVAIHSVSDADIISLDGTITPSTSDVLVQVV